MGLTKIEYAAVGKILREDMAGTIHAAAQQIAADVARRTQLEGAVVEVKDVVTDRAVSIVMLGHFGAEAEQATSGTLTRAASSVGLEVKSK